MMLEKYIVAKSKDHNYRAILRQTSKGVYEWYVGDLTDETASYIARALNEWEAMQPKEAQQ